VVRVGRIIRVGISFRRARAADCAAFTADTLIHTGCTDASWKVSAEAAACREMKALSVLFQCSSLMPATKCIQVRTRFNSYIPVGKNKSLKNVW